MSAACFKLLMSECRSVAWTHEEVRPPHWIVDVCNRKLSYGCLRLQNIFESTKHV